MEWLSRVDAIELVNNYIDQLDWRVKENANRRVGVGSMKAYLAESIRARWMLVNVHRELAMYHYNAWWHAHDLPAELYCCGYNVQRILQKGIVGSVISGLPKWLMSACGQIVNFVFMVQQDHAGAVGLGRVDLELAPYIALDRQRLTGLVTDKFLKLVENVVQGFVYDLNMDMRAGLERPFTNITLDFGIIDSMKNQAVFVNGECVGTYGDFEEELRIIDELLMKVYLQGDTIGRPFTFPIPTVNVTKDFKWDEHNMLWKVTAKWGTPYFCNMIGTDLSPNDISALCCRLHINMEEVRKAMRYGGLFGSPDGTGSVCVTTLNMPRIMWVGRKEEDRMFEILDCIMDDAYKLMLRRRAMCEMTLKRGLLPTFAEYVGTIKWHFNTFSIVGVHEGLLNFGIEGGIIEKDGLEFAVKILRHINEKVKEYSEYVAEPITVNVKNILEGGDEYELQWRGLCNIEQAPAESASYRLKEIDIELFGKNLPAFKWWEKVVGEEWKNVPYTNSTHLPVILPWSVHDIVKHQEKLNKYYTGGSVVHIWLGEAMPDWAAKEMVKNICTRTELPYFTLTPTITVCRNCKESMVGVFDMCPKCGSNEVEWWSRVVGYYSKVDNWHKGKQVEFRYRVHFGVDGKAISRML